MKITVLEGSPHVSGSSNTLAREFMRGASESGHEVVEIEAACSDIHPCIGCGKCGMDGPCVFKDDNALVRDSLLGSDMVVFATPIYYFGMSAQLKIVVDRFYSYTSRLSGRRLKAALITAAWDSDEDVMPAVVAHYEKLCRYMNFDDVGKVLGLGCGTPEITRESGYMEMAYELGRKL